MRKIFAAVLLLGFLFNVHAQGRKIIIHSIAIEGNISADASTVRLNSGLAEGASISGDDLQEAIRNLWSLGIFSDVQIFLVNQAADGIDILIRVKEFPRMRKISYTGYDALSETDVKEALNAYRGMVVTPSKIADMKERLLKKYMQEGYLLAKVSIDTVNTAKQRVDVNVVIDEGAEVQIEKITFHGNTHLDSDDLLDAMEDTKEDRWWRSADFDETKYLADKDRVAGYYKENGYRDAEIVKDSVYYSGNKEDLYIDIWIYEGNKYYFGDLSFDGNKVFSTPELAATLGIQKGDVYDQKQYDEGIRDRLQKLYYNQGYLFARITPLETPVNNDTLNVTFNINEGQVVRIKNIEITGNTKTNEKVIRREFKIYPGNIFNSAKLERSVRELQILNYFSNIVPDVRMIPDDPNHVNLKVNVAEKSTDTANMSAGYSERDGVIGSLGLSFNNFSLAHPLSGGDGQRFSIDWQFGRIYRSFSISFTEPWLMDTPTLAGFSIFDTRSGGGFYPWDRSDRGASIHLGRRFYWPDNYFRGDWIIKASSSSISNIRDAQLLAQYQALGTLGRTNQFSLTQIITRDSRNSPEFPTFGSSNSLSTQLSGGPLGGDQHYFKSVFTSDWFIPLPFKLVLYAQNKFGIIKEFSNNKVLLFGEYFYMGGSGLGFAEGLRGYEDGQVGPLTSSLRPLGGRSMVKSTLELRFPISQNPTIFGLLFAEGGNTWQNIGETNPFQIKRSMGAGVRLFMPLVGIIGIDFGYGFDYLDEYGNRSGKWKMHFQFGRF